MCRYDDLKELKIWEELKLNYQAELEMRINMERNAFLIEHAQLQIDTLKKKLEMNTITREEKESGIMFEIPPFYRWMDELFRVMKNSTHFYCMSNQKNLSQIISDGEKVGFKVLNILVWDKGMHTPLGYYMQNVEFIVLFRKGGARKINNMGSTALISIKGIRGNKIHPSEKPVELYDHLILNSSNINDICIDPFGGSGTIIESCLKNNRQFIAIEKDPNHFEKMKRRADFNKNFEPQTLFGNEM